MCIVRGMCVARVNSAHTPDLGLVKNCIATCLPRGRRGGVLEFMMPLNSNCDPPSHYWMPASRQNGAASHRPGSRTPPGPIAVALLKVEHSRPSWTDDTSRLIIHYSVLWARLVRRRPSAGVEQVLELAERHVEGLRWCHVAAQTSQPEGAGRNERPLSSHRRLPPAEALPRAVEMWV